MPSTNAPELRCRNGIFRGKCEHHVRVFLGIPYAETPIDSLRFRAPRPPRPDTGTHDALAFGKAPLQKAENVSRKELSFAMGEDCLRLNIWVHEDAVNRPVLVFFHGGYFRVGSTEEPVYNGQAFVAANPDAILITVGTRLGPFGYLDLRSFDSTFRDCNLGLLDMCLALAWIREHAESFGGDPERITPFGNSSGAAAVSLLTLMPQAKGLFSRCIISSGSCLMTAGEKEYARLAKAFLSETGAKKASDLADLDPASLPTIADHLHRHACLPLRGSGIPDDPLTSLREGAASGIDMLIGSCTNEFGYWIPEAGGLLPFMKTVLPGLFLLAGHVLEGKDDILEAYMGLFKERSQAECAFMNDLIFHGPCLLQARAQSGHARVFRYLLTYPSPLEGLGSCHMLDTVLFFGNRAKRLFGESPLPESLVHGIQRLWIAFAENGGKKTVFGDIDGWKDMGTDEEEVLLLDETMRVAKDPLHERLKLVEKLLEDPLIRNSFHAFMP
ncbi:MAG: carboxylesterase family protein [Desulfovibrio sp.]|nr:carboxylesterase family protein [Desulfovibrio sp.]